MSFEFSLIEKFFFSCFFFVLNTSDFFLVEKDWSSTKNFFFLGYCFEETFKFYRQARLIIYFFYDKFSNGGSLWAPCFVGVALLDFFLFGNKNFTFEFCIRFAQKILNHNVLTFDGFSHGIIDLIACLFVFNNICDFEIFLQNPNAEFETQIFSTDKRVQKI